MNLLVIDSYININSRKAVSGAKSDLIKRESSGPLNLRTNNGSRLPNPSYGYASITNSSLFWHNTGALTF